MRPIVILRPEPGASATQARATALGFEAKALPLFEIEPVPWVAPRADKFDALLLTSANALRCAGPELANVRGLPAHCVGARTAQAARQAGLRVVTVGASGVEELLAQLPGGLRLLHLCGEDRVEVSGAQLVEAVPVYASRAVAAPDLAQIRACIALVHSPRAARRLRELVPAAQRSTIAIAAISPAAARAAGHGWEVVKPAGAPNDEALLALAAGLCDKAPQR